MGDFVSGATATATQGLGFRQGVAGNPGKFASPIMTTATSFRETSTSDSGGFTGFMSAVTGITDVFGRLISSRSQSQQGKSRADAFAFNAAVLNQRAALVRQSAQLDIARQRRRARQVTGSQRAAFAAAGVKLTGTPLEVITADAAEMLLDQSITRFNAENEISSLSVDRQNMLRQAGLARKAGSVRATSTLLSIIPRALNLR